MAICDLLLITNVITDGTFFSLTFSNIALELLGAPWGGPPPTLKTSAGVYIVIEGSGHYNSINHMVGMVLAAWLQVWL